MDTISQFIADHPVIWHWLVNAPLKIILTLVAAVALHAGLRFAIQKAAKVHLSRSTRPQHEYAALTKALSSLEVTKQAQRESRIRTLSSVARSAVSIVVWTWAALSILGILGVNVAPLIASAGIAGVALGFGAQTLVKDFISGIFMLIEDQYGVGDFIDAGEVIGTVEAVSLRLTTVRDVKGTLWFIRNGEIQRIGNYSQDYSIAHLTAPISYRADIERAMEIFAATTLEAIESEKLKGFILDKPLIDGVNEIGADYIQLRIRVRTLPDKQWTVERYIHQRVLNNLRSANIALPYRHFYQIEDE
ncbi:mechanosensitive ion channel family protein [Corynebacterium sp. ES2794-CONJ1]|uniref:mechanosensitive ion channel family protein n=1 Tax=unclassified Corynebacterium TaxID=2624378 RepID=UPI002168B704|nr:MULTISPECIES: mechanosensitive ion channel family protein [unclassified Corynebacterium]MCS4490684.1 mechanosensitive ion channel family protein [Corynebacterium sp. ES2775-CONJ]MCS4492486.1 mechanosensitive ion channel family protein [Corynebacterium sp. ES2715-CONJ3]MCS4532550.1 mechanosensitive ion channel family protein [Corynebacterium sp. ES2730-CONJ]MCU9519945.1 mechanosensitive ion channel family protein [Corynebacterium sp. ES2794-CONJ1]